MSTKHVNRHISSISSVVPPTVTFGAGPQLRLRNLVPPIPTSVAERFGVHARTVHYWESGEDHPRVRSIPKVLQFLGYDPFPTKRTLPAALKDFRLKSGLTQAALAEILGVRADAVSTWESERRQPSADSLRKIRQLLMR